MRLWKCEFCEKWDFEIVNFVKNEVFVPVALRATFVSLRSNKYLDRASRNPRGLHSNSIFHTFPPSLLLTLTRPRMWTTGSFLRPECRLTYVQVKMTTCCRRHWVGRWERSPLGFGSWLAVTWAVPLETSCIIKTDNIGPQNEKDTFGLLSNWSTSVYGPIAA